MLCYRCGSHVPDSAGTCDNCGQPLAGAKSGAALRRRPGEVDAPFKVGDVLARRYRIKEVVGQGPLGFVFRAADEQVDVEVAIKLLQPRLLQSEDERVHFSKVIRTSRKFSHPSLARTYEDDVHEGWPFFTAPHCDGMSLRRILEPRTAKKQFFTVREIEPIFAQLAAAVDAAHAVGPHGDLKPENVILQPDVLKVTDFGLGLALPRLPFIQAQKPGGGHRYLAPEYLAGGEVDGRADVYALGVILGEMLCGQVPVDGRVPTLRAQGRDLPVALEGIYRRAVNENPAARFRNASELLFELRGIDGGGKNAPPPLKTRLDSPAALPRVSAPAKTDAEISAVDATQPISAAELAARLGRPPAPPPPTIPSPPPVEVTAERPGPDAAGLKELPTMALPITVGPPSLPSGPGMFAASRGETKLNRSVLLLAVLCVSGLALGAVGGLWLVRTLRPQPAAAPAPVAAVEPSPLQAAPSSAPATPSRGEPPANPAAKAAHVDRRKDEARASVRPAALQLGCPSGMKLVPAGSFKQGTARDDPMMGFDEKPLNTVEVRAFCVDEFEYPDQRGVTPKVKVSWLDARKLCEKSHKRLCSETEWEKACKGPEQLRFPYGNAFDAGACATEDAAGQDRALAASGRYGRCRSGYGVFDLSGNAAEWTASSYSGGGDKVVKGGAFDKQDYAARCSARKNAGAGNRSAEVGFRCCADPVP